MHKKVWYFLFFLALVSELLCIQFQYIEARYITKPLLVLLLIGYFLSQVKEVPVSLKVPLVLALAFSWIGDVLLLFESQAAIFFILGLSSFLIAHLFYIYVFNAIRLREQIRIIGLLLVPVIMYYGVLLGTLHARLGSMQLPVYVYGLVICAMLFIAIHLYKIREKNNGFFIVAGALLFVVSDSVLAFNKFYQSFDGAGIIIMLTYGLAQWCIVEGCIRWLHTPKQQEAGTKLAVQ